MIRSRSRSALAGLVVLGSVALAGCGAGQIAQTAEARSTVDGVAAQVGAIAIRDAALEYPVGGVYEQGADARLRMVVVNGGDSSDALTSVTSNAAPDVTIAEGTSAAATGSASAAPSGSSSPTGSATFSPSPTPTGTASGTPTGTAEPPQSSATAGTPSASASGSPGGSASAGASPTPSAPAGQQSTQIQIPPNGYVSFRDDGPRVVLTGLTRQLRPGQNLRVTLTFRNAGPVTMTIAVATPEAQVSLAPTVSVEPGGESEG